MSIIIRNPFHKIMHIRVIFENKICFLVRSIKTTSGLKNPLDFFYINASLKIKICVYFKEILI